MGVRVHRRKSIGTGLVATVLAGWAGNSFAEVHLPEIIKSADGQVLNVRELAVGGALVVVSIKGARCTVCRTQLTRLGRVWDRLEGCGANVIILTPDDPKEARKLQRDVRAEFVVVSDPDGKIGDKLRVWDKAHHAMFPAMFLFNRNLERRWSFLGRGPGLFAEDVLLKQLQCEGLAT